jgi:Lysyl oxidase
MLRSKSARILIATALAGLALSMTASNTAAKPAPATLRLISVLHQVTAERFQGDHNVYFSPGVYVAAQGGPFEIDVTRNADGSYTLWQVQRSGGTATPIRQITPAAPVRNLSDGLPKFFQVTLADSTGAVVATKYVSDCLSVGYGQARVDPSGPYRPQYPYDCGSPLTESTVWGLDAGWASELSMQMRLAIPDGTYTMTIAIAPTYVQQLGIAAADASATLSLRLRTTSGGFCKPGLPCPVPGVTANLRTPTVQPKGEGPASATKSALGLNAGVGHGPDGTPDMRALPPHDLSITHDRRHNRDYLNFGATIWNAGSGPFVVEGFRAGAQPLMTAVQYIYQNGAPVSSQTVGQFEFDTRRGHHHWHLEDIAQYDLLDASNNRVVLSQKQSFCLAPTDGINLTLPGADWQPDQAGLWSACAGEESIWLREVLPAGWGDTYYQSVAGQSFNITNLPNGTYTVRVTTDPNHNLLETDYTNNVGLLSITLKGTTGHRTFTVNG